MYISLFTTLRSIEVLYHQYYFLLYILHGWHISRGLHLNLFLLPGLLFIRQLFDTVHSSFSVWRFFLPLSIHSLSIYSLYQTSIFSRSVSCPFNSHASNELPCIYPFVRFFQMILFPVSVVLLYCINILFHYILYVYVK